MSVMINEEICIGCGLCVHICPKVFEMNEFGKAIVVDPNGEINNVAFQCPVQAIRS